LELERKVEKKIEGLTHLEQRLSAFKRVIEQIFGETEISLQESYAQKKIVLLGYKLVFRTWLHIEKFDIKEKVVAKSPVEPREVGEWEEPRSWFAKALVSVLQEELGWDRYTLSWSCDKCKKTILSHYGVYNHSIPMYIWTVEYYPCRCKPAYPRAEVSTE